MPNMKLIKRVVEAHPSGDRDIILWDTELKGFGCKVTPRARKVYFVYYRTRDGQQRRPTIGLHGTVTCEQARETAKQWLAEVAAGGDPSAQRKAKKDAPTIGELSERYLTEHVEVHNKPSTAREVRRLVESRIKPTLGRIKVHAITRAEVKAWHHAMRETPYEGNRAFSALSKLFSLAVNDWQLRLDNPCKGVKRYPERKRERFFSEAELARIGAVLTDAERERTELPGTIAAVRLLALTGLRLSEVLMLRWEHFDRDGGALRLPDAKAGARTVSLGALVLATLSEMEQRGHWIVAGPTPEKPFSASTLEKAWRRIRQRAQVPGARLHDFRHTVGTYAAQTGANAFMVRDKLGHKTLAMTGRYVERDADPLRVLSDKVENRIAAAMKGKSGEVVEIKGRSS